MDYSEIRKLFLKGFLGFLVLTALLAIYAILTDSFGETQAKILGTSSIISAASILSMACAAFLERRTQPAMGMTGIALAVTTAAMGIFALWAEYENQTYIKIMLMLFVGAVAFAHAFLLLLPKLDDNQKWVQQASSSLITILALMLVALIWGDFENEWYFRILSVFSILVGLVTLTVPLMMKLRKGEGQTTVTLRLEQVEGNVFEDAAGKHYTVNPRPDSDS